MIEHPARVEGEAKLSRHHGAAAHPRRRSSGVGPRRRFARRVALLLAVALAAVGARRALRPGPPEIHPERLVANDGPLVKEFALRDARGRLHTPDDWRGRKAVAIAFLGADCPASEAQVPTLKRLAKTYGPQGIGFYAVYPDPDATAEAADRHAAGHGLDIPALADPAQGVAGQAGIRVTPAAVVLATDGEVLYRGRIGDPQAAGRGLEAALAAVAADETPVVAETAAAGRPLPRASAATEAEGPVTYTRHVAPILWKNCAECHRPGEVGPFSLLTYRDAARRAGFLAEVVESRRMPPWKPHPGFGTFFDARRLTDRERATIARWAEAGAPRGDPADLPPPPRFTNGWRLGEPDLVVAMPEPFRVPASGRDIYRAFVLPIPLGRDQAIAAVEFRPGNRKVVHHARMFVDETGDSRRRDAADTGPGFVSGFADDGVDIPHPSVGAWTPGMTPRLPPEGAGMVIKAGSDLVLMVHYHPIGKAQADRSRVGLFFRKAPPTRALAGVVISTPHIDIPAGRKRHTIRLKSTLAADAHAYSVTPHAHSLLRELVLTATLPDGTVQPLLWINDWDFAWQDQYRFAKPVRLPKGTRLDLVAHFDNSEDNPRNPFRPPRRVRAGPATTDEMLACHIEVIPDRPDGYRAFKGKSTFGL